MNGSGGRSSGAVIHPEARPVVAGQAVVRPSAALPAQSLPVSVHWEATGLRVHVPVHKPLLFGLLDVGIPLAYACMQGYCRTCRVTLTQGSVLHAPVGNAPNRGKGAAQDHEACRAQESVPCQPPKATVLLCIAYPASAHLSLALHP